MRVIIISLLKY